MTEQERNINKDKRYVMQRGCTVMVHDVSGNRVYEGADLEEATKIKTLLVGSVLTDLSIAGNELTVAQVEVEKLKAAAKRGNMRYLTVNHRSGKKLYMGNDCRTAQLAVANSSCTFLDLWNQK